MKKYTPVQLIRLLGAPAATVLLGLVLLFSPDTASALVGKLLGWCCILSALALGAGVFLGTPAKKHNRILWAVICLFAGIWLLQNPLTVAKFLGRVLGIALMIRGGQSTVDNIRYKGKKLVISRGLILGAVTFVFGAVLAILPLASSRMFFNVIGIILICLGVAQGADNLRGRKLLDEGDDPNIIDVEKL
jgi:uncharacterized membrane protein HdeD (DUF308 family)